jgi:hypothetical protein
VDSDYADAATSSADSVRNSITSEVTAVTEELEDKTEGRQQPGEGGVIHAVLLWMVRIVLAGVQGVVVLEWLLGKVSEALVWAVELGMLLVQPPS